MIVESEIQRLRDEIKRRRAAVTAKVARHRRNGVDLSDIDPRMDIKAPQTIRSKKQLQEHLAELNAFMDRRVNFVAGAKGQRLNADQARELMRLQEKVVQKNQERQNKLNGIAILGDPDNTIGARKATLHRTAAGNVVNAMFPSEITPLSGINGQEGLEKSLARMRKMLSPEYNAERIKAGREQLDKMLEIIGHTDLIDQVNNLNDYQFDILFNESGFTRQTVLTYDILQRKMQTGSIDRGRAAVLENSENDLREFLEWAATLEPNTETTKPPTKKR
jgi:hypothetical protein